MPPRRPRRLAFRPGPGARIGYQRAENRMVELMTATNRAVGAEQGPSGKGKVADRIKHLVAHELIAEPGTLGIEDAVIGNDQGVLERSTQCVTRTPQRRHITHEAKSAGSRYFPAKSLGLHIKRQRLSPDQIMIEADLGFNPEAARIGQHFPERVSDRNPDRLEYLDVAAGGGGARPHNPLANRE